MKQDETIRQIPQSADLIGDGELKRLNDALAALIGDRAVVYNCEVDPKIGRIRARNPNKLLLSFRNKWLS